MGLVPPLVGVAVNINALPVHVGLAPVVMAIFTAGVTAGFTTMLMVLEVAVVPVIQLPPVTVITQLTALPFANVVLLNVAPVP